MTAQQERTLRLRTIRSLVAQGRYADAYDRMSDIVSMGRTQRWLLAAGSLRLALYNASCGEAVNVDAALAQAERAAR